VNSLLTRIALIFFLGIIPRAHADVLFLDLNLSAEEVQSVRTAGQTQREALVVYPQMRDRSVLPGLRKIYNRRANAYGKLSKLKSDREEMSKKKKLTRAELQLQELNAKSIETLQIEIKDLTAKIKQALGKDLFSWEKFKSLLTKLSDQNRKVTTLILSGHSLGLDFWGVTSTEDIERNDLIQTLNQFPGLFSSLNTILLWGCYTGTLENLVWWNSLQVGETRKFWVGFMASGPSTTSDESPELLKQIMTKKAQAFDHASPELFEKWFWSLSSEVRDTNMAAMVSPQNWYGNVNQKFKPLEQSLPDCLNAPKFLKDGLATYKNFQSALLPEFSNPPEDLHHSPLRSFYDQIQKYRICADYVAKDLSGFFDGLPTPFQVSALIHFSMIEQSFFRAHEAELVKMQSALKAQRLDSLPLVEMQAGSWKRANVQKWIATQTKRIESLKRDSAILKGIQKIQKTLIQFEDVPARWITGD